MAILDPEDFVPTTRNPPQKPKSDAINTETMQQVEDFNVDNLSGQAVGKQQE